MLGGTSDHPLRLTTVERAELETRVRSRAGRARDAKVARTVLLLADQLSYREIAERDGCSEPFISEWKQRFSERCGDGRSGGARPAPGAEACRSAQAR